MKYQIDGCFFQIHAGQEKEIKVGDFYSATSKKKPYFW